MFAFALWDEAEQRLVLRPRPLRHQAALLHRSSTAFSIAPPRRRRSCRSCPEIETDLDGLSDYLVSSSRSASKTLFKGVQQLLPGHCLAVQNGTGTDSALLGGPLRARLRPHRAVLRRTAAGDRRGLGRCCISRRRPGRRLPERRSRLEHRRRRSPRASTAPRFMAFTGRFDARTGLRRDRATPRALAAAARLRAARDRHRPGDFVDTIRDVIYPPGLPGRRARLVPAVHRLAARRASTGRSCSADRVATRSSVATRAT